MAPASLAEAPVLAAVGGFSPALAWWQIACTNIASAHRMLALRNGDRYNLLTLGKMGS
jgi:hypothetical protein